MISIDDFAKVEVKVGTVTLAERIPETDKLLRLVVDFGDLPVPEVVEGEEAPEPVRDLRQIVSGIQAYVEDPETLVGRQLAFVTNLAPRKLKGYESNGMLFAVGSGDTFAFLTPDRAVPPGTKAH